MRRLLICFAGIGDLVVQIPMFRKLSQDADLDLLTRPYGKPLFLDQSYIACTHVLKHPNRGKNRLTRLFLGGHRKKLGEELAIRRFYEIIVVAEERDVIVDWVESWRAGATCRTMDYYHHRPDKLLTGLRSLGIGTDGMDEYPVMEVSHAELKRARARLAGMGDRIIGVQVGSGRAGSFLRRRMDPKGLQPAQWGSLLTGILEAGHADAIVFNGTVSERYLVPPILKRIPAKHHARIVNWMGKTGLHDLKSCLAGYYAFLSIDTGPAHIAAAVGCPLLVFFGPADPATYLMKGNKPVEMVLGSAPCQFCTTTRKFRKCRENICMRAIGDDELWAGWLRLRDRIAGATPQ